MNTVSVEQVRRTEIVVRLETPMTARDIGDFVSQVDNEYEKFKGKRPSSDDAYIVRSDDEGIEAVFEVETISSFAQALGESSVAPDELASREDLIKAFKKAWKEADAAGKQGSRVEAGLEAVFTKLMRYGLL